MTVKPATDPLMGMDAREWAREFLRIWSGRWSEVDEALMIGWFANAIMRGFDGGRKSLNERCKEQATEIAALKGEIEQLTHGGKLYPCEKCGKSRTKAEGGTVFAVCDACWDLGTGRAQ